MIDSMEIMKGRFLDCDILTISLYWIEIRNS